MTSQRINYGIRLSPLASDNPNNLRYPMVLRSIRELLTPIEFEPVPKP